MFSFLFRLAYKAATVQRFKFITLMLTLTAASLLVIILSALYLNNESQMVIKLSGVPNIVITPKESFLNKDGVTVEDIKTIKSPDYFWHANIVTAAPVMLTNANANGKPVKLVGTWFKKNVKIGNQSYNFGLLTFTGWNYELSGDNQFDYTSGQSSGENDFIILGADIQIKDPVTININGNVKTFHVAGRIITNSFWDNYIFIDSKILSGLIGQSRFDEILVSATLKPDDKLSTKAEQHGMNSLSSPQQEMYMCSGYPGVIKQTMQEILPKNKVKILRPVAEVQAGIITSSRGVFGALFLLTLIAAVTAIISAEKMYISSHLKDFGIMLALGAENSRIFIQLLTEISLAAVISAVLSYLTGLGLVPVISNAVYGVKFQASAALFFGSIAVPFIISSSALIYLNKSFKQNVTKLLR